MQKYLLFLLVLIFILLGGYYYFTQTDRAITPTPSPKNGITFRTKTPTSTPAGTASPTVTPSPAAAQNIVVTFPVPNSSVVSPVHVEGKARTFESAVDARIRDKAGKEIARESTVALVQDTGKFGPFKMDLILPQLTSPELTLEVFSISPKDGSEIDKILIPLRAATTDSTEVKAFFSSEKLAEGSTDCARVFPVVRKVNKTQRTALAALQELLKGLSKDDEKKGYRTSIPQFTRLQKLSVEKNTARADFNETLQFQVAGSCRVTAIRAQITETLKQFSSIQNVVISIDGKTEDILQP